ncbi:MAG: hypothetical protein E7616_05925 [Ruminococcaceae bacterium]|nr:hypothetical protein [Oscillospiraceae bacterium]
MEANDHISDAVTSAFIRISKQYPFTEHRLAGKSLLGKELPVMRIGQGNKNILLLGGADAAESISESLLLQFTDDLCRCISLNKQVYHLNCAYLCHSRSFWILPRINPDGRALVLHGADPSCVLYERQMKLNGMKSDFSDWHANARGICPHLNFNDRFAQRREQYLAAGSVVPLPCGEFPESEPETAAICSLIRLLDPTCIIELGKGDTSHFYADAQTPLSMRQVSHMTGFFPAQTPFCGAGAWFYETYRRPYFYFSCPDNTAYHEMRKFLFSFPALIGV